MCFSLKLSDATPGGTLQFLNVSKTFIFAYKVANFSDTNLSMNIDFSLDFGEEVEDEVLDLMVDLLLHFWKLMNLVPKNYFSAWTTFLIG